MISAWRPTTWKVLTMLALIGGLLLVIVACGGDDDEETATPAATTAAPAATQPPAPAATQPPAPAATQPPAPAATQRPAPAATQPPAPVAPQPTAVMTPTRQVFIPESNGHTDGHDGTCGYDDGTGTAAADGFRWRLRAFRRQPSGSWRAGRALRDLSATFMRACCTSIAFRSSG